MEVLQFPKYAFRFSGTEQKKRIFDIVRKKFIPLTPEEWVRQHVIHFLHFNMGVGLHLMAAEREIKFNSLRKRFDVVVFNGNGEPACIVECKAPNIKITKETIFQIGVYNKTLRCPFLLVTNGITHFWFQLENGKLIPSEEPPGF